MISNKELGHVLVLDQASNLAGCSLWHNGNLIAHTVLRSHSATELFSRRVQYQVTQLDDFLDRYLPKHACISSILFEGVRARLVLCTVGAFLTSKRIACKMHQKTSFVESSAWKQYAKKHGATGPFKLIKGMKALREIGFDVDKYGISSEDTADSVLMYLTWREQ